MSNAGRARLELVGSFGMVQCITKTSKPLREDRLVAQEAYGINIEKERGTENNG